MEELGKTSYTDDVPEDREDLVRKLIKLGSGKVMFVGDVDTGKSTSLIYVANRLIEEGFTVAIVDSDVGQKGILPPATISLAFPERNFSVLEELRGEECYFIGTNSPSQHIGEMAVGVWRLASIGRRRADFVLVDTTGYVCGRGADMKRLKAELLRPDFTVFLERGDELSRLKLILRPFTKLFKFEVSPEAKSHSRELRRDVRARKWRKYFSGGRELVLENVHITGTSLFHGRRLTVEEKELIEKIYGWIVFGGWRDEKGTYHIVKAGTQVHHTPLHAVDIEKLSNLLVGLLDSRGLCRALGILKSPGIGSDLEVLTPLDGNDVAEVRFGRMRVTEEGEELELLRRDEL